MEQIETSKRFDVLLVKQTKTLEEIGDLLEHIQQLVNLIAELLEQERELESQHCVSQTLAFDDSYGGWLLLNLPNKNFDEPQAP